MAGKKKEVYAEKYSRQSAVREIGAAGQKRLHESCVAIVGLGALGTVVSELLARSGAGKLILIDRDIVEESNLQRQLLYNESDIGKPKAPCAREKLLAANQGVNIEAHAIDRNHENADVLEGAGVIVDCTDNLWTRFLINDF